MGADVVQLSLRDHTHVDVAPGAEVVEDACGDGVTHQLLGLGLLSGTNDGEGHAGRAPPSPDVY